LEQHVHDFGLSTVEGEYRSGGESDLRFRSSLSVTIEGCWIRLWMFGRTPPDCRSGWQSHFV